MTSQSEGVSNDLKERIESRAALVAVIGLGYVGLPLALALAEAGYPVLGIDIDAERVAAINRRRSYIADVPQARLASLVAAGRLRATNDYNELLVADIIFICVPTPFTPAKAPDLSYIEAAAHAIAGRLQPGRLIVLQSTTHPGTTEDVVLPILEQSGLKAGADFHLAFAPERINPGDTHNTAQNTPRVVGGIDAASTELARLALAAINPRVYVVSSPRTAEMSKLLENTFRSVNIALVNELALLCERMGIDIWEVIAAAATKPFGFMPFYPGPGVGGHCIPVDPYYLSWKAREYDFYTKFVELAADLNQSMPYHVAEMVATALNSVDKPVKGSRLLVLGVAFKRDIDDSRNSPAERVIALLLQGGAEVAYHDPYVRRFIVAKSALHPQGATLTSVSLTDRVIRAADAVVIVTGHSCLDYHRLVRLARVVVDCCNATQGIVEGRARVVRLGAPPTA